MKFSSHFLIIFIILASACVNQDQIIQTGTLKGFALTPQNFNADGFTDFFVKAGEGGEVVAWAGDWFELDTKTGSPMVVISLASNYNYIPVIEAGVASESQRQVQLKRPLDAANIQTYKTKAAEFAKEFKPNYMAFGVEINSMYESLPSDFETFVSLYKCLEIGR